MSQNVTKKISIPALAVASALALAVLATSMATPASAKITPVTTDVSCENQGGNEPGGQQPSCTGGGLTQNTETENQNPSGAAPPGQNK
jgi:hypothetical protein